MFRHLIWTAVVVMMASGLCLAGPDDKTDPLDDANKTLKEGDKTGKTGDDQMGIDDADKTLKGEDGEDQGEKIDPLAVMKQIIDEMRDAEDALGKASAVKSLEEQKKAIKNMDDIINKTRELQEKILADMEKLFGGAGGDQDEALKLIEKIIKYARENSPEGSPSSSQQQQPKQQPSNPTRCRRTSRPIRRAIRCAPEMRTSGGATCPRGCGTPSTSARARSPFQAMTGA
jgi:hypothetical protein